MEHFKIISVVFLFTVGEFLSSGFAQAQIATTTPLLSDTQQIIEQLSEQIKTLQAKIQQLESELAVTKSELVEVKAELKFTKILHQGATGNEVKKLQGFLKQFSGIYPEGLVTGYFGPLTEKAVQRFQLKHGIVASGTSETTGYGQVGPKTQTQLNQLLTEGAGKSDVIPPGLLIAPGIQKKISTTLSTSTTIPTSGDSNGTETITIPSVVGGGGGSAGGSDSTTTVGGGDDVGTTVTITATTTDTATTTSSSTGTATTTSFIIPLSLGPWITDLSITPISGLPGTIFTFTITAEDPSGLASIAPRIKYPGSNYTLNPNWQFYGAVSGTQTFTSVIDHGISPTLLGEYVIEYIKASDSFQNHSFYYPNGTVINAIQSTHNLTIPSITITDMTTTVDTTPAKIFNVQVINITSNSANVLWETDEPTTGSISYGDTSYGPLSWWTSLFATSYNRLLYDLSRVNINNIVYYKIKAGDASGNQSYFEGSFNLDKTPPVISNIQAINITDTSATITWITNESSDSSVTYTTVSPPSSTTASDNNMVISHSFTINGLKANKSVTYTVTSTDVSGNTTTSSKQSFMTN